MRVAMKWSPSAKGPTHTESKHLVDVWADKYGHTYYYDPINDCFWHRHDHRALPEPMTAEKDVWLRSAEGFGR